MYPTSIQLNEKPVYVLFVDLSAFNHINKEWLFKFIEQRFSDDEEKTLFSILNAIYSHATTALAETPTDTFNKSTGVRQGGPESPKNQAIENVATFRYLGDEIEFDEPTTCEAEVYYY